MSDLLLTATGRNALLEAQREALRQRMSRFFGRNVAIDIEQYRVGGEFDLGTMLGALNVNNDDEILDIYTLLGSIGGLNVSIADTSIYVNATTGSDVTGTGSASRPFASLWFLPHLPLTINHSYRILINSDLNLVGTNQAKLLITNNFGVNGCLSFIGVGPEVEVLGAFSGALTAVTNHFGIWNELVGNVITTQAVRRSFLQLTSGVDINNCAPVVAASGAASRFYVRRHPTANAAIADTYRFVEPARKLTLDGLDIDTSGSSYNDNSLGEWRGSHVNFINLSLIFRDPLLGEIYPDSSFSARGLPVGAWFCDFRVPAGKASPINLKCDFNWYNPIDMTIDTLSGITITNPFQRGSDGLGVSCGMSIIPPVANEYANNAAEILSIGLTPRIKTVDCMARVLADRTSCLLRNCSMGTLESHLYYADIMKGGMSSIHLYNVGINPNDANVAAVDLEQCHFRTEQVLFGLCSVPMNLRACRVVMSSTTGGDANGNLSTYDYCCYLSGQTKLFMFGGWQGEPPITNDAFCGDPNPDLDLSFPAAGLMVTDLTGNDISRPG